MEIKSDKKKRIQTPPNLSTQLINTLIEIDYQETLLFLSPSNKH